MKNKVSFYRGMSYERTLSGWYVCFTTHGYMRADTVTGIRAQIDNYLKDVK